MAVAENQVIRRLLAADEPAPHEVIPADSDRPVVLACDHASRRLPWSLGTLGVPERYLDDHIAWDIGAAAVTRILCRHLRCGAVLGNYSRLVVDLNRDLKDPAAFPEISDGVLIPGNLNLGEAQRAERSRSLFHPFHEALRRATEALTSVDRRPAMMTIHSFTPRQHGLRRPWDIGVLWDVDARLPLRLMEQLRAMGGIRVADNMPYSGRHPADFTLDHHAEPRGLAHAGIEIRQDLIDDSDGQACWGGILARALEVVLADEGLYRPAPDQSAE